MYYVAMAADNNYAQHLGVCLVSLFENNKCCFTIYVFENDISIVNKEKIGSIASKYGQKVFFVTIDDDVFSDFSVTSYYSLATWFRICLGQFIEKSVDRLLYLDCDIIVNGDIEELMNVDLRGFSMAAVMDTPWQLDYVQDYLGTDKESGYFNAGVMLIDMRAYRAADVFRKAIEILKEKDQLPFQDQDILNIVFEKHWLELPCKWNLLNGFLKKDYMTDPRYPAIATGIRDHVIVHYSAKEKPWSWRCMNPLKDYYYKYLDISPWKGFYPEVTVRQQFASWKNCFLMACGIRKSPYISFLR